jgi:hypothetical protein
VYDDAIVTAAPDGSAFPDPHPLPAIRRRLFFRRLGLAQSQRLSRLPAEPGFVLGMQSRDGNAQSRHSRFVRFVHRNCAREREEVAPIAVTPMLVVIWLWMPALVATSLPMISRLHRF